MLLLLLAVVTVLKKTSCEGALICCHLFQPHKYIIIQKTVDLWKDDIKTWFLLAISDYALLGEGWSYEANLLQTAAILFVLYKSNFKS